MALLKDRRLSLPAVERLRAHLCADANLARAEIIEALAFLAARMRHLEPGGEPCPCRVCANVGYPQCDRHYFGPGCL